eukprot:jgi/Mesvir1/18170/Mv09464-RA.1
MLQSIALLNDAGEVILERQWSPLDVSSAPSYVAALSKVSTLGESSPVTITSSGGDVKYCFHLVSGSIVLLGCCDKEVPALLVLEFLRCVASTLSSYFGNVPLSEELIRENFILAYELLDEMVDAGLPTVTDPSTLEDIVPPPRGLSQVVNAIITGGAPAAAIGASLAQSGLANAALLGGGGGEAGREGGTVEPWRGKAGGDGGVAPCGHVWVDTLAARKCGAFGERDLHRRGGVPHRMRSCHASSHACVPRLQEQEHLPSSADCHPYALTTSVCLRTLRASLSQDVSATLGADGSILHGTVHGSIKITSRLSGCPEVHLTFERGSELLSHALMHPCVRMAPFLRDRSLCFVPPDGVFELCRFVVPCPAAGREGSAAAFGCFENGGHAPSHGDGDGDTNNNYGFYDGARGVADLPLYVRPKVSYGSLGGSVSVMVGHRYGRPAPGEGKPALGEAGHPVLRQTPVLENVALTIRFPPSLRSCNVSATHGSVSMDSESRTCSWQVGLVPLDTVACLHGNLQVDAAKVSPLQRPSIQLHFSVIGRPLSGLQVNKLTVLNVPYKPVKAVRFVTRACSVDIRAS